MADDIYQPSFWDDEESELWDELAEILVEIHLAGVDGALDAIPENMRVFVDWDRVNTSALEYARKYRYDLIKDINDTTRRQVQDAVSNWIQSGAPLDALEAALERTYGPVRAAMIAQTETTRVFAEANRQTWESAGLVGEMEIRTAVDDRVCPICGPKHGTRVSVRETNDIPPFHVRCRCWLQPIVSEELLGQRLDEVLA